MREWIALIRLECLCPGGQLKLRKMADCMGVSFQALVIRLKTLGLLMPRDLTVYLENDLQLGGAK